MTDHDTPDAGLPNGTTKVRLRTKSGVEFDAAFAHNEIPMSGEPSEEGWYPHDGTWVKAGPLWSALLTATTEVESEKNTVTRAECKYRSDMRDHGLDPDSDDDRQAYERHREKESLAKQEAAAEQDVRKIKHDTHARLEAQEEWHEERARQRMEDSDERFDLDSRERLGGIWDSDPIRPTVLAMTNGDCLLYESARNVIFGPSESGKTFSVVYAAKQEMDAGRPVIYIDWENGPHGFKDRLKSFGVTREQADDLFWYFDASGGTPPSADAVARMAKPFKDRNGRLVIVDTTTPAMASLGLSPRDENDVESFYVMAGDPWAQEGFCWVAIDHTPNDNSGRALGSQQKKSGVSGMALNIVTNVPFSRHADGYSDCFISKDRHGGAPDAIGESRYVGQLHIMPSRGEIEIQPVDAGTLAAQEAEREAKKEAAKALRAKSVQRRLLAWWRSNDTGDGLFKSYAINGNDKHGVPSFGGKTGEVNDAVRHLLSDSRGPLVEKTKGRYSVRPDLVIDEW